MKKFIEFIKEEQKKSLIIVDVQEHDVGHWIKWKMKDFVKFVNSYEKVLVLFNGKDLGWESEEEMRSYYEELGIDLDKCYFFEKYYGFFRGWLDLPFAGLPEIPDEKIIKAIRYMRQKGINQTSEMSEEDFDNIGIEKDLSDDIWIPEDLKEILKKYNGSDVCGGGKNECLKEVEILMEAFDIKYNTISKWVY